MKLFMVQKTEYNGYECNGVVTWDSFHKNLTDAKCARDGLIFDEIRVYGISSYDLDIIEIDENGNMKSVKEDE